MPITNPQEIILNRQDDLEAIIGHPPSWSLRWGMTVLFGFLALLLGISWFVSYPDIVEAPVLLTTQNPPIRLVAKTSAKIVALNVQNEDIVKSGDVLGVLDNPANSEDILEFEAILDSLSENDPSTFLTVELPNDLELGNLQREYAIFSQNFADLQYFLQQDINFQKISNLRRQIIEINKLEASLSNQIKLFEQEMVLSQIGVTRDSLLRESGSISKLEFERTKTAHLVKSRQLERLRSESATNQLEIRQLEAGILDLRQKQSDDQSQRIITIKGDIQRIKGAIEDWKQTWLLIAPIDGKIALTNAWSEQQFVKAEEEVLTVIPLTKAGSLIAKAQLKGTASGKVDTGMVVHIRLTGYPYQEFGVLNGTLSYIASVPNKDGYEVEINLPEGMKTSYEKELEFHQEMEGVARVITEERSLLMRILEKIKAAFED